MGYNPTCFMRVGGGDEAGGELKWGFTPWRWAGRCSIDGAYEKPNTYQENSNENH
jgi:hypothetical protein